ncbi:MAG: DUF1326 domain-containing protein [Alphaproteobacteria bacterium]|nr:DUF1326 domain-containing protein [Alphaproteobacteria bacterium]
MTTDLSINWKLEGMYFEACNCDAACPCVFLSPPTTGECTVFIGWHIDKGIFGDTNLDGLSAARAVHTPGHMLEVEWTAALYLDERASETQTDALTRIFTGQVGGSPSKLAAHIGNDLGVRSVPIDFRAEGKKRSVSIPNVVDVEIAAIVGQGDGDVTISGHPLCVAPGHPAVASRSSHLNYTDHGLNWEINEKTGFFSPFNYSNS